jgi:hypothetical protein
MIIAVTLAFRVKMLAAAGRIKVSSTSKIKKMTAIRKNWVERGRRAELMGSNPHSNGEGFSRSLNSFLARRKFTKIRAVEITIMRIEVEII